MFQLWYATNFLHVRGVTTCTEDTANPGRVVRVCRSDEGSGSVVHQGSDFDGDTLCCVSTHPGHSFPTFQRYLSLQGLLEHRYHVVALNTIDVEPFCPAL